MRSSRWNESYTYTLALFHPWWCWGEIQTKKQTQQMSEIVSEFNWLTRRDDSCVIIINLSNFCLFFFVGYRTGSVKLGCSRKYEKTNRHQRVHSLAPDDRTNSNWCIKKDHKVGFIMEMGFLGILFLLLWLLLGLLTVVTYVIDMPWEKLIIYPVYGPL